MIECKVEIYLSISSTRMLALVEDRILGKIPNFFSWLKNLKRTRPMAKLRHWLVVFTFEDGSKSVYDCFVKGYVSSRDRVDFLAFYNVTHFATLGSIQIESEDALEHIKDGLTSSKSGQAWAIEFLEAINQNTLNNTAISKKLMKKLKNSKLTSMKPSGLDFELVQYPEIPEGEGITFYMYIPCTYMPKDRGVYAYRKEVIDFFKDQDDHIFFGEGVQEVEDENSEDEDSENEDSEDEDSENENSESKDSDSRRMKTWRMKIHWIRNNSSHGSFWNCRTQSISLLSNDLRIKYQHYFSLQTLNDVQRQGLAHILLFLFIYDKSWTSRPNPNAADHKPGLENSRC